MFTSKYDAPLIAAGLLISIKNNNQVDATRYMDHLLLYTPIKTCLEQIDSLLMYLKDPAPLRNCIRIQYRSLLAVAAIKHQSNPIVDFIFKENFLAKSPSDDFCNILSHLLKYDYHSLAESAIKLRKIHSPTNVIEELNKTLLLIQFETYPDKSADISFLHQHGANPMAQCKMGNKTYIPILTAIELRENQLIDLYIAKHFSQLYSEENLVTLFEVMIQAKCLFHAEHLLKMHDQKIIKNLSQTKLDKILYQIATSNDHDQMESKKNLITFLIQAGANPITSLRMNDISATQLYNADLYDIFNKDNLDKYTIEDLSFAMRDALFSKYHGKQDLIKLILTSKKEALKIYFNAHQDELDYLLFYCIHLQDDSITHILLEMGANPLTLFLQNTISLDIALEYQYYEATKIILENHLQLIPPGKLANAFKTANENKWSDLTHLITSPKNPVRKEMLVWLLHESIPAFINLLLSEENSNPDLLLYLCQSNDTEPDKKYINQSILDYALEHHESDMIKTILTNKFQKLTPQRLAAAIKCLLEIKDNNHVEDVSFTKYIEKIDAPNDTKREITSSIFLHALQNSISIQDILSILSVLKSNKKNFAYLTHSVFNIEMKKITQAAISQIMTLAKQQEQLAFTLSQYNQLQQFLNAETGFGILSNPKNDFAKLSKEKIKIIPESTLASDAPKLVLGLEK